jgi:hypothetical protein
LKLIQIGQPWRQVRFWLYDLANELGVAEKDGTSPAVLALDRVWITADGRAKLLDFPAPGVGDNSPAVQSAPNFLNRVATAALTGHASVAEQPEPDPRLRLPLHARSFLDSLPSFSDAPSIARTLHPLLQRVAEVTKLRRAAIVAGCLALPIFATGSMFLGIAMMNRWTQRNPGVMELNTLLHLRDGMNSRWVKNQPHPTDRQFAIYVARHYGQIITNESRWTDMYVMAMIQGKNRQFAEQSLTEPAATEKETAEAEAALNKYRPSLDGLSFAKQPWFVPAMFAVALVLYVGVPALLASLLFRGGLVLLISGVTFVRRDGARASRLRVFWRGLVAWSPLAIAPFVFEFLKLAVGGLAAGVAGTLFVCLLAVISMSLPTRGLPDRLSGTWPVPR